MGGGRGGKKKEKNDENSGHYHIASSRPHERRTSRTLLPIIFCVGEITPQEPWYMLNYAIFFKGFNGESMVIGRHSYMVEGNSPVNMCVYCMVLTG